MKRQVKQRTGSEEGSGRKDDDTAGMSPTAKVWVELAPLLGIGWVFAASMATFAALGWWLDGKLGTGRKLLIAGSLLGMGVGFVHFFQVVLGLKGGTGGFARFRKGRRGGTGAGGMGSELGGAGTEAGKKGKR